MLSWLKTNAIVITLAAFGAVGSYNASQVKTESAIGTIKTRVDGHDIKLRDREVYISELHSVTTRVNVIDSKIAELAPDLKGLIAVMHSIDKRMAADAARNTARDETQQEIKNNQNKMQMDIQDIKVRMAEK